jgi:hypothetical protein
MRFGSLRRFGPVVVALGLFLPTAACFDSTWGEAKRAQEREAARVTPTDLKALSGAGANGRLTPIRVHVVASPKYTAQVIDAPKRFRETVDEANCVLSGAGVVLDVASFETWSPSEDDLPVTLAALEKAFPGNGEDLYVGLVGSVPRLALSFHDVGYATVLGHHVVLRAPSRADDVDAIQRNLDELSTEEREQLIRSRRNHRAAVVLLHELGHTLGAVHETAESSIMSTSYAAERSAFGPGNMAILNATLRHRAAHEAQRGALAREILGTLDQQKGDFVPADLATTRAYVAEIAERESSPSPVENQASPASPASPASTTSTSSAPRRAGWLPTPAITTRLPPPSLSASTASAVASASAPTSGKPSTQANGPENAVTGLDELSPAHRELFRTSNAAFESGDAKGAWDRAKPLFSAYPNSYAVQDLRCKMAMALASYDAARPECDSVMRLSRSPGKK